MKVAVLMSTYNGEKYIEEQVSSILDQDFENFTLIIRDDGSTSQRFINCLKRLKKIDKRIIVLFGKNIGVKASFLKLLEVYGEYDYMAFADQDDYWYPRKLSTAINLLKRNQNKPSIYFSGSEITNEHLDIIGKHTISNYKNDIRNILCQNQAAGCTMIFNKPIANYALITKQFSEIYMHDWWLMIIGSFFGEVIYDEEVQIKYRQHSNNALGGTDNIIRKFIMRSRRLKSNDNTTDYISRQAKVLVEDYSNMLNNYQIVVLEELIESKVNIRKRFSYCFSRRRIRRNFWLDNIIFKFLIILNKY